MKALTITLIILLSLFVVCSELGCDYLTKEREKRFVDSGIFEYVGYDEKGTVVYFRKTGLPPAMHGYRIRRLPGLQTIPDRFRGKFLKIYEDGIKYYFE